MTLTAWRICKLCLQERAYSVEKALNGGRWTSPGVAVVYASGTIALAHLELLVHLDAHEIREKFVLCPCSFEEGLVTHIDVKKLPHHWRDNPAPHALRHIGDEWAKSLRSPVLSVPSALVPLEHNYLINLLHPQFKAIQLCDRIPLSLDSRLLKCQPG